MKKFKKTWQVFFISIVALVTIVPALMIQPQTVKAVDATPVDPNAPLVPEKNALTIAKSLPEPAAQPTITGTASFTKTTVDIAGGPKVSLAGNYNWSRLVFNGLSNTDSFSVEYPYAGKYDGKPISLKMTFTEFYNAGNTFYNKYQPAGTPAIEIYINQSAYNGYVYRGIESFKLKYEFKFADGKPVVFNNDGYLGFNSLNGYNELKRSNGTLIKDDPYFANYKQITEGVSYLNADPSSKAYTMQNGNMQSYPIADTSAGNPTQGSVFAGANNNFEDELGALTYTKNSVSFQIKGSAPEFFVVGSRGSAWNTPTSAPLFNTLPQKPEKRVSDSDETLVLKDTLKDLEDGIKNGVTYTVSQQIGTLGVDVLTKYTAFGFSDTLNDIFDAKNAVVKVKDSLGNDLTSKFDIAIKGQEVVANAKKELIDDVAIYDGRTYTMTIAVKIDLNKAATIPTTLTSFPNVAKVAVNNTPQETNKVETLVLRNPMTIEKKVNKEIAKVGEEVEYSIIVKNPESIDQSGEVSDDITDVLQHSDYQIESIAIDGKKMTDAKDNDAAEITNKLITTRLIVPAKGQVVITFKVKATKPTGDDAMLNTATLKTPTGEVKSNEVKTIVPGGPVPQTENKSLPATGRENQDVQKFELPIFILLSIVGIIIVNYRKNARK